MPLARLTIGDVGADVRPRVGEHRAQPVRRHRRARRRRRRCTPPRDRRRRAQRLGQRDAREVVGVLVRRRRSASASSGARAHSVVGALPATIAATAVPHDPAPIDRDARHARSSGARAAVSGSRHHHVVVARRGSLRIDLARPGDALDDRVHDPVGRVASRARRVRSSTGSPTTAVCGDAPLPVRLAALDQDAVRAPQPDRHDRRRRPPARAARCPTCRAIGSRSSEIVPSGNTATHSPRASASTAAVERVGRVGVPALHRDLVRGAQQRAEPALVEQLGLGEEPHAPAAPVGDVRERQRVEIRDVVAREDHRARASGCARAPSIVHRKPVAQPGQNTPFATEYTASTVGSIRSAMRGPAPCPDTTRGRRRPAAVVRARQGAPRATRSTTTRAPRSRARWPSASSPPPATRPIVIVSSAPEVVAWARARGLDVIDDPGSLDARGRRRPRVGARARPRACRRRARRPPARDVARRRRRRRRRARSPCSSPTIATTAHPCSSLPADAPFAFAYGPGSFARHVAEARARRPRACASCATPRSASTSTSPDDLAAPRAATPLARDRSRRPRRCRARALAIGAHPDDIEFGCGATLAKWADAGAEVHAVRLHRRLEGHVGRRRRPRARSSPTREDGAARRGRGRSARSTSSSSATSTASSTTTSSARAAVCARDPRGRDPTSCSGTIPWQPYRLHPDHRTPACSRRRHRRGARPALLPRAGRRAAPARRRCCCSSRRASTTSSASTATSTARSTRCSRTGASGARRWASTIVPTTSSAAFVARAARRGAQPPGSAPALRAGRGVRPHRRPLAVDVDDVRTRKGPGCTRALLRSPWIGSALLGGALARRAPRRPLGRSLLRGLAPAALRFAGAFLAAFLAALRRTPCAWPALRFFAALRLAAFFAGALRLAAFLAALRFVVALRLAAFFAALRFAEPSRVALRFAGAFFAALRLAGAFLAALFFVAFLAGGTVTTFLESSHSREVRTSVVHSAREGVRPHALLGRNFGPGLLELRTHGELRGSCVPGSGSARASAGSIPVRALRSVGANVPKPGSVTLSPPQLQSALC